MKTFAIVFALFAAQITTAKPVEEFSRQQTRYVNHLKETSTGAAILDQDFKRYSAKATFADGNRSYTILVYRVVYGDLLNFLVLLKSVEVTRENLPPVQETVVRGFHATESNKIEETILTSKSSTTHLEDGSSKTFYESDSYSKGAYSIARVKDWSSNGSLTETDFVNMNEKLQSDATITDAHQTTYSLPITLDAFRGYLPKKVRLFFENFRNLHLWAEQLNQQLKTCAKNCEPLRAQKLDVDTARERLWASINKDDVDEMKPSKPKPIVRQRQPSPQVGAAQSSD